MTKKNLLTVKCDRYLMRNGSKHYTPVSSRKYFACQLRKTTRNQMMIMNKSNVTTSDVTKKKPDSARVPVHFGSFAATWPAWICYLSSYYLFYDIVLFCRLKIRESLSVFCALFIFSLIYTPGHYLHLLGYKRVSDHHQDIYLDAFRH